MLEDVKLWGSQLAGAERIKPERVLTKILISEKKKKNSLYAFHSLKWLVVEIVT